jgi:hypothetical protein
MYYTYFIRRYIVARGFKVASVTKRLIKPV